MYFPIGLPHVLRSAGPEGTADDALAIAHSSDGEYIAVCCPTSIHLWKAFPLVHLHTYTRPDKSIEAHGLNTLILWRQERASLAVALSKGFVQLLNVDGDDDSPPLLYRMAYPHGPPSTGINLAEHIPHHRLRPIPIPGSSAVIPITAPATAMANGRGAILLASARGIIERVPWDNPFLDSALALTAVQFPDTDAPVGEGVHVVAMAHSPSLRVLVVALSNGRAACLQTDTLEQPVRGFWVEAPPLPARGVQPPAPVRFVAAALNPRFRLLALGAANALVAVYAIDDAGRPRPSHVLNADESLTPTPAADPVLALEWSPDCHALAAGYAMSGVGLWSVYGSSLLHPLQDSDATRTLTPLGCRSLSWGPEGYKLFAVPRAGVPGFALGDIYSLGFVKSALTTCPSTANQATLLLQGEDRLYVNPDSNGRMHNSIDKLCDSQWLAVHLPTQLFLACWPLRFAAMDTSGHHIAVAGSCGLAIYSTTHEKWKLFGSEAQEQALVCCGGLAWWRDYVLVGCTDSTNRVDDIRVYSNEISLNERNVVLRKKMTRPVTLLSVSGDYVLTYAFSRKVQIFLISAVGTPRRVDLEPVWTLDILDHVPSPHCVVSLSLISLQADGKGDPGAAARPNALLTNSCGRLMVFPIDGAAQKKANAPPALIATNVEMCWAPSAWHVNAVQRQLSQAIWLACGPDGMKVWLSLPPQESDELHVAKRVMLPLGSSASALSVLFFDLVLVGATSEVSPVRARGGCVLPFFTLQRQAQLYLHHILRQLLRRSLDNHALQLARACTHLSYFSHVLELMLHEVLEEEAVNDIAIVREDALLPRIVAFIAHFPVFREVVVHCARKTEVAKWSYLFAVLPSPTDLFEKCVADRMFDTAASFLVIMQTIEDPDRARAHAIALLHTVLDTRRWDLARDILRFLQVSADGDGSPEATQALLHEVLGPYAMSQLENGCIYQLGAFAAHCGFELVSWMSASRAQIRVRDFSAAIAQVQRDFQASTRSSPAQADSRAADARPAPEPRTPAFRLTVDTLPGTPPTGLLTGPRADWEVASSTAGSESVEISFAAEDIQSALDGYTVASQSEHRDQLRYMLNVAMSARCLEWAFVLALVLRDRPAAQAVLDDIATDPSYGGIHALMARFEPSLRTDTVAAYQDFYDNVASDRKAVVPVPPPAAAAPAAPEEPRAAAAGGCAVS
eukprot:m.116876 g.116876  ORF g.116876 m.116876 type:complete len:1191 (-) comp9194_c0_seq3:58-3630(-)